MRNRKIDQSRRPKIMEATRFAACKHYTKELICLQSITTPNCVKCALCCFGTSSVQTSLLAPRYYHIQHTKAYCIKCQPSRRKQNYENTATPQNQPRERHWYLKTPMSHNNGIKTALIPTLKNNWATPFKTLDPPQKHFTNNQLKR